ncbi:glycine/betaine ABC transporter substrate-binding protein [Pseudoduganella sp. FT26W]|uniref:Glycine/betaine ABC transporter substrate-binding protein n=1 Tax=Duganella aquatilis TaxID=2666082 RepID=A0A844CZL7_9BURK|nr:glycine betaine ABC transporter substrate-binding protein [Duganella aquatilis]MRW84161.1 glycine/betaine ABC transporter substrate-binding protein [Duganella aquatilis]
MPQAKISRRSLLAGAAAAMLTGAAARLVAAQAQAQNPGPVVLGQVSLSFYAVTGAVIQNLLEKLGHTVVVRQGPHEEMFPLLDSGDIDLMAAAWLPEGHAAYWKRYGQRAQEVAVLYEDARFFWAVPDYVPASEVGSIADLAKPQVAARMSKRIQSVGSGAAITVLSHKAVGDYQLGAAGYAVQPGPAADWIAAYEKARAAGEWMVFPTWAPQYLNRDGKLRPLQDTLGVLGGTSHASLVGSTRRLNTLPRNTLAVLARVKLGIDAVTEMDYLVNVGKLTPREAASMWMERNHDLVTGWLQAEAA